MKLSYGLTVCNEHIELEYLLGYLNDRISPSDEIVVVYDKNRVTKEVMSILDSYKRNNFYAHPFDFKENFLENKNYMNTKCSGDYIFQIDADEIPCENLLANIKDVVELNPVDIIITPRKNLVAGLTEEYVKAWGWRVTDKGWVNWPDNQKRIYRNTSEIMWTGHQVHGMITGYKTYAALPEEEEWCIIHNKSIDRQINQNNRYAQIEQTSK